VDLPIAQQAVMNELGEKPIAVDAWGCHIDSFRVNRDRFWPSLRVGIAVSRGRD
jgi:hypothetical protein